MYEIFHCHEIKIELKKRGYLLIELVIALTILMMIIPCMLTMQAHLAIWYKETKQYIAATDLAQDVLVCLQQALPWQRMVEGFEVQIHSYRLHPHQTYMMHYITVSFITNHGTKHIGIAGGSFT